LVAGYHPGCEDDGVYLSAIKHDLVPSLYPHDADFFALQLQASVYAKAVAGLIRLSHAPAAPVILALHLAAIFLVLLGCLRIARRCFAGNQTAQWMGVAMVTVLLTLPVAGTALYLVDQNLHPRALATAAILAAVCAILDRKWTLSFGLLAVAVLFHPMMGAYGISFCLLLAWQPTAAPVPLPVPQLAYALLPLSWVFAPVTKAWYVAANTRGYYFLSRWEWYEWLGVFAPVALLCWFRWSIRGRSIQNTGGTVAVARIASRLLWFAGFQFALALALILPPQLDRLKTFQPMRFLHLVYLLLVVLSGGMLGQWLQRIQRIRWAALLIPLAFGMFAAQRQTYASSAHFEFPGARAANAWLQAFEWIRANTPTDSFFAIGGTYMERPGEDYHSFRALAERSLLADVTKDGSVVTQVPSLAPLWLDQVSAQQGFERFGLRDFKQLHSRFGVDWVVVELPAAAGLVCPYQNGKLKVCHLEPED
jgi:hypothetical protein